MSHTVTEKHYEYFKQQCVKWIKKLGAVDYRFEFEHDADEGARAEYDAGVVGRWVIISLASEMEVKPTKRVLDICAFHEVFESSIIQKLRQMAQSKYSDMEVDQETHRIIRTLENLLFGIEN